MSIDESNLSHGNALLYAKASAMGERETQKKLDETLREKVAELFDCQQKALRVDALKRETASLRSKLENSYWDEVQALARVRELESEADAE